MSTLVYDNARICIGEEKCLLTWQTGGITSRFVFKKVGDRVLVERTSNESAPQGEPPLVNNCELVAPVLLAVMLPQFTQNNVVIDRFEWELDNITFNDALLFGYVLKTAMGMASGARLRVKKLIFGHTCFKQFEQNVVHVCDKRYLKAIDKRSVDPETTSAVPLLSFDHFHPNYLNGITMRFSRIFLSHGGFEAVLQQLLLLAMTEPPENYVTYRAPHGTPRETLELFALCESPVQKFHGRLLKREFYGPSIVLRHNLSSCGYWITAIRKSHESSVDWESETCGLGEFCTKCTSPSDHDNFMNLPRRLVDDPKWISVFRTVLDKKKRRAYFSKLRDLIEDSEPVKTEAAAGAEDKLADEMSSMNISEA